MDYLQSLPRRWVTVYVPLGVFLSGGMDSSTLVALTSRITKQRPKTFSVVFDEPDFDEAPFSRVVAKRFNTDHSEIRLSEDRLIEILPQAIAALMLPFLIGAVLFSYFGLGRRSWQK